MKLNIEVESGAFEKAISDGIAALSAEEMGSIIKQVVYEAFTKCPDFKSLLIGYQSRGWGGPDEPVLGPLAIEAVKSIDMDKELAQFKEKMVKALMENHREIVENMLLRCMIDRIVYHDNFLSALEHTVRQVLAGVENNG